MSDLDKRGSKSKIDSPESDSVQKKPRTISEILSHRDEETKHQTIHTSMLNKQQIKPPDEKSVWGCLQFYENSKLVLSQDLWTDQVIKVTGKNLGNLNGNNQIEERLNFLSNYSDWEHIIGEGFCLKRHSGILSKVDMFRLDNSSKANKYKIFSGDHEINLVTSNSYEIYNPGDMLNNLDKITDTKSAYDFKKYCQVIIGIHGEFMKAMGPILSLENITKDRIPSMPFWFLLKLNPEFSYLDKKIKSLLK
ncbi:unnamed protein product [Brachionus calyciflorus]|uniref:Uncharacterized protein n=1 Tax=Brachionus calyciflorus TaxID=104777 RepID=A0A814BRI9_9BILA|nr:unnamed protein product [Brachionus calyciflorus]